MFFFLVHNSIRITAAYFLITTACFLTSLAIILISSSFSLMLIFANTLRAVSSVKLGVECESPAYSLAIYNYILTFFPRDILKSLCLLLFIILISYRFKNSYSRRGSRTA